MTHKSFIITALSTAVLILFSNCGGKPSQPQTVTEEATQSETPTFLTAIENYLATEIGGMSPQADHCIPSYTIVESDISDTSDIRVWGDWWVFSYNLVGDTLKTVSGGNHPGLFHVQKINDEYTITNFEQVGDGSEYLPSAQRIFGNYYTDFQQISNNSELREADRANAIAEYVKKHGLKATVYQDYGWPAVPLKID